MNRLDIASKWVLVTGASSGLGQEVARYLVNKEQANVLLVARRAERLNTLKTELESSSNSRVDVLACDLTNEDEYDRVLAAALAYPDLAAAVLNAGVTFFGPHDSIPLDSQRRIVSLNVDAKAALATSLVKHWQSQQQPGGLLLVSSLAGHFPLPYQALYSGTKGFITNFGIALAREVSNSPVSVTVFSPGGIATEMIENSGLNRLPGGNFFNNPPTRCARYAVDALLKRRMVASSSWFDYLALVIGRAIPYRISTWGLERIYRQGLP